jgi:DNA replication protein DnaC
MKLSNADILILEELAAEIATEIAVLIEKLSKIFEAAETLNTALSNSEAA